MSYASIRNKVQEALRASGATRLAYLHADHFEPWRTMPDRAELSEQNVADIMAFIEATSRVEFARKLTLFMKSPLPIAMKRPGLAIVEGDEIGFAVPTGKELVQLKAGLAAIPKHSTHEMQIHLHHEFLTKNDLYAVNPLYQSNPAIRSFLAERTTQEMDEKRFDLMVKLTLSLFREATGLAFDPWFFVHGMWALNGSDAHVCHIHREIEILLANGCAGDFTFPAGRSHTDPQFTAPALVLPVNQPKGYDTPEADPRTAFGAGRHRNRFFIWASRLRGEQSSIDYYAASVRRALEEQEKWALDLVKSSVVADGTIYVKTHAHSMYPDYFTGIRVPIVPHLHPGVQSLLGVIFDGASAAGLEVEFLTAHEVYDRLLDARPEPGQARLESDQSAPYGQTSLHLPTTTTSGEQLHARIASIEPTLITAGRTRIATLGQVRSGATEDLAARLKNDELFSDQELELAATLARALPGDTILHLGCGCGTFAILLAAAGLQVVGLDSDPGRVEMARAMARAVAKTDLHVDLRFVVGEFPAARLDLDPAQTVVFLPGIAANLGDEAVRHLAASLSAYRQVILDPDRFFRRRPAAARRALLTLLRGCGFDTIEPFGGVVADHVHWRAIPSGSLATI